MKIARGMSTSSSIDVPGRSIVCEGSSTVTSVPPSLNCANVRVPVGWTRSMVTGSAAWPGRSGPPARLMCSGRTPRITSPLVTREVDYSNHLANTQDPNEKKEQEQRDKDRMQQLQQLEEENAKKTPEQRAKDRERKPIEFGSADDFMLQQAVNKLEGKPVQLSKSVTERKLAENKPQVSASAPVAVKPAVPAPGASAPAAAPSK